MAHQPSLRVRLCGSAAVIVILSGALLCTEVVYASVKDLATPSSRSSRTISCLTHSLLLTHHHWENATQAEQKQYLLLNKSPSQPGMATYRDASRGLVFYDATSGISGRRRSVDRDRNDLPDQIDQLAVLFERIQRVVGSMLAPARGSPIAIYLTDTLSDYTGFREAAESHSGQAKSFLLVDPSRNFADPDVQADLVHQFLHTLQLLDGSRASAWLHESEAIWLESKVLGETNRFTAAIAARASNSHVALASQNLPSPSWFFYLEDLFRGEPTFLQSLNRRSLGEDDLSSFDELLRTHRSISLAQAYQNFSIWRLVQDKEPQLGRPDLSVTHLSDFVLGLEGENPPESFGANYIVYENRHSGGGLQITFDGEGDTQWGASILTRYDSGGKQLNHLRPDGRSRDSITIPLAGVRDIILVVQNLSRTSEGTPSYNYSMSYTTNYPFRLQSFAIDPTGDQTLISWSTAEEHNLMGWNIYRSQGRGFGLTKVNRFLIPSQQESTEPLHYLYIDSEGSEGEKQFYHLEAVTIYGFRLISSFGAK